MKKLLLSLTLASLALACAHAQVTCGPVFPTVEDSVTIFYNATQGNGALAGISPVFAHMGVITDKSTSPTDWKYVATTWGVSNAASAMQNVSPNIWRKKIDVKTFFNVPANETVLKLSFVFRNAGGSIVGRATDGSDMYYDLYPVNGPLQTRFTSPADAFLLLSAGQNVPLSAAASKTASLEIFDNGVSIASGTGVALQSTLTTTSGLHRIEFIATAGSEADTATFQYLVPVSQPAQDPPSGTEQGIQYLSDTAVRLSLYAPGKQAVYALGDFNNWQFDDAYQMKRSVDGNLWWIDLNNLQPGQQYRFQYFVNGMRIADPLSTLILDPGNDPFIPALTYPNRPVYPNGKTSGLVSVLQTAQIPFNWTAANYQRPKKTDLIVYELLMRDFIARHDYQTLLDTLDYLEQLGITAIELMPVSEFGGNQSWGYNPSFHKALDKYYGTAEALKLLVDECHQRNMAVILDVVYNHVTGDSPHAQLYWDAANNRPAANSPWLNTAAKHDFNVFNDYNHESIATKTYVKNTLEYWIEEFRIDGFRFDLSKGFTQKNTLGDVGAWGQYDPTRIAIWKDYADFIWNVDPETYILLEHFAVNTEEKELAEYGMMIWGNLWGSYKEAALGYSTASSNTNMSGVSYKTRGWNVPHLVGYMESHDEDRIAYECKTYGNSSNSSYNIKTLPVAMRRIEMLQNLLYTVPGPKMMWQFGELGYDYTINYCPNGTVNTNCRVDPKPIRWDYLQDPYRRRLHDVTAALLHLRKTLDVFETNDFTTNISSGQFRSIQLNNSNQNQRVFVMANIGTAAGNTSFLLPTGGWWYEYFTGDSVVAISNGPTPFTLSAGEYRLYTNQRIPLPPGLNPTPTVEVSGPLDGVVVFPNPTADVAYVDVYLREQAEVYLTVNDALGRMVYQQHPGRLSAGDYRFEVPKQAPGMYFVRVEAENGRLVKRLMVH